MGENNATSTPTFDGDHDALIMDEKEDKPLVQPLPLGEAMSSKDTYSISASELTRFIVLIGATGSGKTTLITSIYHQFLQEDIPHNYLFAGSKTLPAFEQRAYYTRITCEQSNVQMQRTSRDLQDCILHLRVRDESNLTYKNILLTDFSGESYESVSANVTAAYENFKIVRAAHSIGMILDGEKISSKKYKIAEVQKTIHMLRTFSDANLINSSTSIIIIISKYDLIFKENNDELFSFVADIPTQIEAQIPELASRLTLHCVAAMPNDGGKTKIGYGIIELFDLLLTLENEKHVLYEPPQLKSQFNLFGRM